VREDLGAEMADFDRWGRGPGAGVALSLDPQGPHVESGTALQNGPGAISTPMVNRDLYDQGFISLSGVPMLNAGTYKNPLTGVEYTAFESALPPPDADYEETLTAPARNVKLAHLQGGWTDNTPRPTKVELVEDDFHMQYDRSINTFGTYDPSRYVEMFERNNRFTRNDEHPDPDGPELVGVPANIDGNQNVKIRPLPYLPPTNRGKWGETTFRSGIDARVAVGNSEMQVDQTYTVFHKMRLENTRMDGGGMQVTQNTMAPMDTQMGGSDGGGRRDIMPTQRSTTEGNVPYMAPATYVRLNSNTGTAQYNAPTGDRGVTLVDAGEQYGGGYGATTHAGALTNQQVEAPTGYAGTDILDMMQVGAVQPHDGVQAPMMNNQLLQSTNSQSGVVTREDQYGSFGGDQSEGPNLMLTLAIDHAMSKSGVTVQRDDYGSYGGVDNYAQMNTDQHLNHMMSKSGVAVRTDAYGSFGGDEHAATVQPELLEAHNAKSGLQTRNDAYGSYGGGGEEGVGQQLVPAIYGSQELTKRQNMVEVQTAFDTTFGNATAQPSTAYRSRFNSKKGPLVDFLMPSGSMSGTEGTQNGSQNYGYSTSLNSKKEAQYGSQWGFMPQVPSDPTVMYGFYNQTMEHMNSRPYGNMQHLVAPASYGFFMQETEA